MFGLSFVFMARDYRKLKVYGLSYRFLVRVYKEVLPLLPDIERHNLHSQLQRAATSIVLNIAEGASHRSNRVFANHLQYSYGSAKEVDVLLALCLEFSYVPSALYREVSSALEELKASLFQFMKAVEKEVALKQQNYSLI